MADQSPIQRKQAWKPLRKLHGASMGVKCSTVIGFDGIGSARAVRIL